MRSQATEGFVYVLDNIYYSTGHSVAHKCQCTKEFIEIHLGSDAKDVRITPVREASRRKQSSLKLGICSRGRPGPGFLPGGPGA